MLSAEHTSTGALSWQKLMWVNRTYIDRGDKQYFALVTFPYSTACIKESKQCAFAECVRSCNLRFMAKMMELRPRIGGFDSDLIASFSESCSTIFEMGEHVRMFGDAPKPDTLNTVSL